MGSLPKPLQYAALWVKYKGLTAAEVTPTVISEVAETIGYSQTNAKAIEAAVNFVQSGGAELVGKWMAQGDNFAKLTEILLTPGSASAQEEVLIRCNHCGKLILVNMSEVVSG